MYYIPREYIIQNNEELNKLVLKWTQILNLQHWEIQARIVPKTELETQASIDSSRGSLSALLFIANHKDYTNQYFLNDMEVSLVHELLHLYTDSLKISRTDEELNIHHEQMIESLAKTLVQLERDKLLSKTT